MISIHINIVDNMHNQRLHLQVREDEIMHIFAKGMYMRTLNTHIYHWDKYTVFNIVTTTVLIR